MTSSIENGVERRSHTNFGDDIITHHQIQPVKVDDLYVSKGIPFDLWADQNCHLGFLKLDEHEKKTRNKPNWNRNKHTKNKI